MKLGLRRFHVVFVLAFVWLTAADLVQGAPRIADSEQGFRNPPPAARPWIFWFWLNGNVTSNGITTDLEAMQRVGIGGVVIMEVDQGAPKGPVAFGSPAWLDLFKHVCGEAQRLGLQVNMNNDAGWCGSGGPWITPELSMQKVVWSETIVRGPGAFRGTLPQPKTATNYYRDVAVFALPTPEAETLRMVDASPGVTASLMDEKFDPKKLLDDDPKTFITLPRPGYGKPQFVQVQFPEPFHARRLKLGMPGLSPHKICQAALKISDNGETFKTIREFVADGSAVSVNFSEVAARYFRVEFSKAEWYLDQINLADIELSPEFRIDDIEAKALFVANKDNAEKTNPPPAWSFHAFNPTQIIDITSYMRKDGQLAWTVPSGTWTVIRFGHASTGEDNQPAPESGRGLECDKLSKAAARATFSGLIGRLVKAVGPLAGKTFVATHVDSWEVGSQNWTPKFREEFERLRGYNPLPFLPVMTGRVVGSLEISERFLWDLRQTVSDLVVENYAGELQRLAHHHGMHLTMEAYDLNPCDDLPFAGRVDEPMAEFWTWPAYGVAYSCIEMASAAHVYGKPIVSAEAFTATDAEKWVGHPFAVKVFGDWAFCQGINRFVLHRYAHQPWTTPDRAPGMSMGPWGLHYERTQTWWEQGKAWHEYLARCQYLLQQGLYVADICYLAPEESPQKWEAPGRSKERPGYNFDGCPPEVVLNRMSVKNGRIVLPDGMSYRLLVLPESITMTPRLLARIGQLVRAGATVLGPRPLRSPGLDDFPRCDEEVQRMAEELWGDCDGKTVTENRVGKGRIISGRTPQEVLADEGVPADFAAQTATFSENIRYTHRTLGGDELFFLANKSAQPVDAVCAFRVHDKRPELWWPDTGSIERPAVYDETSGTMRVPIRFDPNGSVFVVFRADQHLEPDRITSITRDGTLIQGTVLRPQQPQTLRTNDDITNTFTMAVWAKPEIDIDLPEEAKGGIGGLHVIRNDALYPPPGQDIYVPTGQAGSGISVGLNGVGVFEHGDNYFAAPLVFASQLTNWTHVAVVYRDGKPSLYLNGRFAHEGLGSDFGVHPGVGVAHRRGVAPFRGGLGEFQQVNHALEESEVGRLMGTMPRPNLPAAIPTVQLVRGVNGGLQAEMWQTGNYTAKTAAGENIRFKVETLSEPLELDGGWDLQFAPNHGAPERVSLDHLISWSDHPDPGVKYYSGSVTYKKVFRLPSGFFTKDQRLYLDLGQVAVIAEVKLNGKDFGTLWKPPFRVDVGASLKEGENVIEVNVVNLWPNRMIGDEQSPEDGDRTEKGTLEEWPRWLLEGEPNPSGRYSFTSWRLWKKTSPLQQSGLIGPVRIIPVKEINIPR